jgi:hypothetical protein
MRVSSPHSEICVRTTITLDDDLVAKAEKLTSISDKTVIGRAALSSGKAPSSLRWCAALMPKPKYCYCISHGTATVRRLIVLHMQDNVIAEIYKNKKSLAVRVIAVELFKTMPSEAKTTVTVFVPLFRMVNALMLVAAGEANRRISMLS